MIHDYNVTFCLCGTPPIVTHHVLEAVRLVSMVSAGAARILTPL